MCYIRVYNYRRMQNIFHQEGLQVLLKRFWLEFRDAFLRNFSVHFCDFKVSSVKLVHAFRTLWRKTMSVFCCGCFVFQFSIGPAVQLPEIIMHCVSILRNCPGCCLLLTICWARSCERSSAYFEKLIVINSFVWFSN